MMIEPSSNKVPRHLAVILDGNRRFSKRLMLKPFKGHEWGAKKLKEFFRWSREYGIKELTLYVLSVENLNSRPKEELDYLMKLFNEEFENLKKDKEIHENKIRLNFIGRLWMLPRDIQEKIRSLMELTKNYDGYVINFAMAYGGRAEVVDAVKRIANKVKNGALNMDEINEEVFSDNLYMKDEPDLIIRTSESRLSGFLPWQGTYSEIIFLPDILWPELTKEDFVKCIEEYSKRQRKFGG